MTRQNTRPPYICKDENNTVITQMNQNLNRWKEYFSTILHLDIDDSFSNHRIQPTMSENQTDVEILPPSYNGEWGMFNN
jgi:hypothetical protein